MAWETQRALPESMRDSGEGWEKAVHMHTKASGVRQRDSDILGIGCRPVGGEEG